MYHPDFKRHNKEKMYLFFYFSTKTYVVGTKKNGLNETILLSTPNFSMLKMMVRKYLQFCAQKLCLSEHVTSYNAGESQ